jgi:hypothetical protein
MVCSVLVPAPTIHAPWPRRISVSANDGRKDRSPHALRLPPESRARPMGPLVHFGDAWKCTVLIIESRGNKPSWGGAVASLESSPPQQRENPAFTRLEYADSPVTRGPPTTHGH